MTDWNPGPAWLFCPADRPDRYPKALAVADVVILDLEDAVAPANRPRARDALRGLTADGVIDLDRTVVRVNANGPGGTADDHAADLAVTAEIGIRRVMLSKSEDPDDVALIRHEVVLLIETPRGVEHAATLAAQPNVVALMWGADDLVAGLGGTTSRHTDGQQRGRYRDVARYARSRSLVAAKTHGRLALDAVHMDIPDTEGLAVECEDAAAVGFDGTVAIHPRQVEVIRAAYTPSEERVDWARRLLEHVGDDRAVTTFEGRMVDGPIYKQAERVLQRASAVGKA